MAIISEHHHIIIYRNTRRFTQLSKKTIILNGQQGLLISVNVMKTHYLIIDRST